jgi:hypothetical protein
MRRGIESRMLSARLVFEIDDVVLVIYLGCWNRK